MRNLSLSLVVLGLIFSSGCASTPNLARVSLKSNSQASTEFVRGRDLEAEGKLERARQIYEQLWLDDPKNVNYLHRLGVVCAGLHRYGESDHFFQKAHDLDPRNATVLIDFGYSYYLRGDDAEAERLLRKAVHTKPSDKRARGNLALVIGRQGKYDECLALLMQIEDRPTAMSHLASIQVKNGKLELAEKTFRGALELDPNHSAATTGLQSLTEQRKQQNVEAVAKVFLPDEPPAKPAALPPAVQQVAAKEFADQPPAKSVINASFEEDAVKTVAEPEFDGSDVTAKKVAVVKAEFTDDPFDAEPSQESTTAEPRPLPADSSEWDADIELTPTSKKGTAPALPEEFDPMADAEPFDSPAKPGSVTADAGVADEVISEPAPQKMKPLKFVPRGMATRLSSHTSQPAEGE